MNDDAIAQLAGTLSAISVVVAEICKLLPDDARARLRRQIEALRDTPSDGGPFAASVMETCDRLLQDFKA